MPIQHMSPHFGAELLVEAVAVKTNRSHRPASIFESDDGVVEPAHTTIDANKRSVGFRNEHRYEQILGVSVEMERALFSQHIEDVPVNSVHLIDAFFQSVLRVASLNQF